MALDFPNSSIEQTYIAPNGVTYVWNGTSWVVTPILSVSKGGTGFTSYVQGEILYGNSSGTLSKLNPSTSGYVLSTNGTGADPSWIAMSAGGGAGTVAIPGAQFQIASYYSGTGASVSGSTTFTNDTNNAIVNIGHTTASTNSTTGALVVAGGVGVAKTSYFGQDIFVTGNMNVSGTAITLFSSVTSNYLIMNTGSSGVLRIQTDVNNSRVRMFENMTTGTLGFFGTSGGTLYLGTDSGTANGNITIRGNNTTGGGGNQRAAIFTLATATSNGSGSGGTMVFQTSTSGNATSSSSNALRTRLRIEGAATGTSNNESIIILGDTNAGTAWTSYLRGVDATGTNVDAGEIQIQAGRSTGTGNAQGVSFYVSPASSSSSTLNTANQIARLSATGLTINSTTASTTTSTGSLIVSGGVGIGGSLNVADVSKFFQHLEIKTQKELRFYNSADSQYVAFKSGTLSGDTTYTLPTAFPGSGSSFLTSDTSGVLTWASVTSGVSAVNAGAGISIPSSTGSVTVSIGRPVVLNLASGFTPVGIGTDYNILRVPEGKNNTNTNYNIKKVIMGVGTTSSGTSTIRLEKSSGPHTGLVGFSISSTASTFNAMTSDLSLIGGLGETSWVDFKSGYGTAATGDRIRVNYTAVDATHANFIIQCLLEEY